MEEGGMLLLLRLLCLLLQRLRHLLLATNVVGAVHVHGRVLGRLTQHQGGRGQPRQHRPALRRDNGDMGGTKVDPGRGVGPLLLLSLQLLHLLPVTIAAGGHRVRQLLLLLLLRLMLLHLLPVTVAASGHRVCQLLLQGWGQLRSAGCACRPRTTARRARHRLPLQHAADRGSGGCIVIGTFEAAAAARNCGQLQQIAEQHCIRRGALATHPGAAAAHRAGRGGHKQRVAGAHLHGTRQGSHFQRG